MPLVVAGAARSSPGTTTTVLALAGCLRDRLVVEGDPDGAVLSTRFGLAREPNLASLAANTRASSGSAALLEHAQALPGGIPVVPGLASADHAVSLWRSAGPRLGAALAATNDFAVLVDAGRLTPTSPLLPLLAHAAMTVLIARPTPEHLYSLAHRLDALRDSSNEVVVVLVGDKPYGPAEVSSQLGADVLGVIAHDPRAASTLAGEIGDSGRAVRRSALARSARGVAGALLERLDGGRPAIGRTVVMPA
jgi:MinD-like ATPase involved in chromosome partitioning or flagellar assembly